MTLPVRFAYALRPRATAPLLAAAVAVATVFASTPFLIPAVSERYGVSVGIAGAISVAQVSAFALMTVVLPRLVAPSVAVYRGAAAALVVGNALSVVSSWFPFLVAVRLIAGAATGVLTWLAWGDAMRQKRSLSALSAAAPLTTLVASPLIALAANVGDQLVYGLLALVAMPLLFLAPDLGPQQQPMRQVSRSRSNRLILAAMFLMTFSGASLFVYASEAARRTLEMSAFATSIGFSLNAAGGLLGARWSGRHRRPGLWLATAGPAAALSIVGGHPAIFYAGLAWWGLAFWMGVPGVMQMLAARSLHPAERAGDAQGAMAAGRALAPLLGGGFADAGAYSALAVVSGIGLSAAGLAIAGVQEGRDRLPPTDPAFGAA